MARSAKLIFSVLAVLGASLYFFISPSTAFSPELVSSNLAPRPMWSIPDPTASEAENLHTLLSQKFTFLGEGEQAIAFQSEDGKTVLKLFKMRKLTPSFRDKLCPHVVRRRLRNLQWVFNGYKNAFQDLRKETGLVWIHLAKTKNLHQTLTVIDKTGTEHHIDADSTEFVIQEKAELIFHRLSRLRKEGKTSELEKAIASVHALIRHRIEKGYADRDSSSPSAIR